MLGFTGIAFSKALVFIGAFGMTVILLLLAKLLSILSSWGSYIQIAAAMIVQKSERLNFV